MVGERIKLIILNALDKALSQNESVDMRIIVFNSVSLAGVSDNACIKRSIVGNKHTLAAEFKEFSDRLTLLGRARNHTVINTGQLGYLGGNGLFGVNKGLKSCLFRAVNIFNRADFGQPFSVGSQPRCFNIKYNKGSAQRHIALARYDFYRIVNIICLHTVDNLYAVFLCRRCRLGKSLHNSVVGYCNGFMTPLCRS